MTESDKIYYENREAEYERTRRAFSKAQYRGMKSVEWHKTNTLTPDTLPAFKKAMKDADKEWELLNKKERSQKERMEK